MKCRFSFKRIKIKSHLCRSLRLQSIFFFIHDTVQSHLLLQFNDNCCWKRNTILILAFSFVPNPLQVSKNSLLFFVNAFYRRVRHLYYLDCEMKDLERNADCILYHGSSYCVFSTCPREPFVQIKCFPFHFKYCFNYSQTLKGDICSFFF